MGWMSALVLFAVVWFMTLFVVLPLGNRTQGDAGEVEPGTPASAPEKAELRAKFRRTTLWALPIWAVIATVILSGWVTVADFDLYSRFGPGFD